MRDTDGKPLRQIASVLLLVLGVTALLGTLNALRPARGVLLLGLSWSAAWVSLGSAYSRPRISSAMLSV